MIWSKIGSKRNLTAELSEFRGQLALDSVVTCQMSSSILSAGETEDRMVSG